MVDLNNLNATLDISGHEFTHGVTHYTAGLEYLNEFGALDESYSDIFGFLTERNHFGFLNWTIGENATYITRRDMQNPKNTAPYDPESCMPNTYPNYYLESGSWHLGSCDYGGVHHNSSVQNQCFYFLAMGGTQLGITVTGIGIDKAAKIAQYALINGLVLPTTTFQQNREAWVLASEILFGLCSDEQIQTCRAWAACNVGSTCQCTPPPLDDCWTDLFRYPSTGPMLSMNKVNKDEGFKIFPNPSSDVLNFDFNGLFSSSINSTKIITITSMNGVKVDEFILSNFESIYQIDISNYKEGVYVIALSINGKFYYHKFVKLQ